VNEEFYDVNGLKYFEVNNEFYFSTLLTSQLHFIVAAVTLH
jgi:hypothetical protein